MVMYVITHKHFDYQKLTKGYRPLLVGADRNANSDNFLQDNTGENISSKNSSFCELTGLYWIWKNSNDETVGLSHYRRYFSNYTDSTKLYFGCFIRGNVEPIKVNKLDYLIKNGYDWIVSKPQIGGDGNLWEQFANYHHENDMKTVRDVIKSISPDYLGSFDHVMNKCKMASFYNMFYTSRTELEQYASWLFKILFATEKRIDISSYDNYQKRLYGFLGERLMNVWLYHRKANVKYLVEFNSELVGRKWAARSIKHDTLGW